MHTPPRHDYATFCPGGCITDLATLDHGQTVVTESGEVLCRECAEAHTDDIDDREGN